MPQSTDANFVVSLDPVIELGGLPIPDVQLSICIPRYHIARRKKTVQLEGKGGIRGFKI